MIFDSRWSLRDRVCIDGDHTIVSVVTGVQVRTTGVPMFEVSWFHNGDSRSSWIEEWRLELANK